MNVMSPDGYGTTLLSEDAPRPYSEPMTASLLPLMNISLMEPFASKSIFASTRASAAGEAFAMKTELPEIA
jgi:hypothetical protein